MNSNAIKVKAKAKPSIVQVAKEAGVAKSTVSHAFSGNRSVSQPVKDRIFRAAEKLDYHPHFIAQALASRRTRTIGVLISELAGQYGSLHVQAIDNAASVHGYRLFLGITGDNEQRMSTYLECFRSGQADGVIVLTSLVPDRMLMEQVKQDYPVVTPLRCVEGCENLNVVQLDIAKVFRRLLQHLYDMGHRQFGFLCGLPDVVPVRYRQMHGFAEDKGIDFGSERQALGIDSMESATAAARKLLSNCTEITALVCSNDVLAAGALAAACDLGLTVPRDLTVTGFDDLPISRFVTPSLTTVRMPIADMAIETVNHLVDQIEARSPKEIRPLYLDIVIRDSSGPARVVSGSNENR